MIGGLAKSGKSVIVLPYVPGVPLDFAKAGCQATRSLSCFASCLPCFASLLRPPPLLRGMANREEHLMSKGQYGVATSFLKKRIQYAHHLCLTEPLSLIVLFLFVALLSSILTHCLRPEEIET